MSSSFAPRVSRVRRGSLPGPDGEIDYSKLEALLSPFQIEKFKFLFDFYDTTNDGFIDKDNICSVNQKLKGVAGWSDDDPQYISLVDNNRVFMECLIDQVRKEKSTEGLEHRTWEQALRPSKMSITQVTQTAWIHMWARLCKGAAGMDDFPIWVQLLPSVLFNIIVAREGTNVISKEALKNFYSVVSEVKGKELDKVTEEGYRTATANGDYELDYNSYKLVFSNFLLGKTIYGPGKYIFGCFDNRDMDEQYKIVYDNA